MRRAPLWEMNPTEPGRAIAPAKVALRPPGGRMMPRQFGPTIRICPARASSRISCSNFTPSSPISLKPAEITTAPFTPASTHSRMMPGTVGAGVTMTARSTGSGTSVTDG